MPLGGAPDLCGSGGIVVSSLADPNCGGKSSGSHVLRSLTEAAHSWLFFPGFLQGRQDCLEECRVLFLLVAHRLRFSACPSGTGNSIGRPEPALPQPRLRTLERGKGKSSPNRGERARPASYRGSRSPSPGRLFHSILGPKKWVESRSTVVLLELFFRSSPGTGLRAPLTLGSGLLDKDLNMFPVLVVGRVDDFPSHPRAQRFH